MIVLLSRHKTFNFTDSNVFHSFTNNTQILFISYELDFSPTVHNNTANQTSCDRTGYGRDG